MPEGYVLVERTPAVEDYLRLRTVAGMGRKSAEAAAAGLPHTLFSVVIEHQGRAVGMGRLVGDGALFLQVVDIAVEPDHQGRGLGKAIMAALMTWTERHALPGTYVSLIADGEAKRLYARYGFTETAPKSVGMARLFPVEREA
ncbi:GNAT family N-acetyltransferase [Brevundimonas sp. M20]|uniref:GNAT family N-acetyltransferase n=1 Tax=Brevundimonas sp. M20 TaxID=2591463 RepID=UPI00114719F4|nr:GNAT family N-acetyltransferase [Brevundimonas sp. M20]QDH74478.1 GNAT family N-acetyltransferase [Brevundimonas sp. M20]